MGGNVERKVKVAEVALRALLCGLGALAATLVATDSQTRMFFSLQKKAKFTDMKALVFLVVANGVAAGYSLLQAARCAVAMARGSRLLNRALAWSIFSCDQALAYVMLAAVAAALQASVISKRGQPELQWMGICSLYGAFCRQAGGGIASAVAAGLAAVLLAFVSAFNLFRLYGGAGKNGATW
ncbi:CASP-like protein 2U1 [Phragmites australis]|uniref:CASP-like protein 2U1 n=1 Tax=Phragmites australis TaxID=29695 RepID=UPI002D7655C7|nr:CASP-like protein 2U1 [Phragmites australis]